MFEGQIVSLRRTFTNNTHIRALKDLNKYEGQEKPHWRKIMAARHRKTLVLCRTCHLDLHAGRPLKHKRSRSRTEILR